MAIRKNKAAVFLLDIISGAVFLIPVLISRVFSRRRKANIESVLIMELWGIGDLAMMSAILDPLKERYPQARVYLLAKETAREMFRGDPRIDGFITFDFPWTRFRGKYAFWRWDWRGLLEALRVLRRYKFDLILDARGDIRNNLLSFLINGKRRMGYAWRGGGYFLTDIPASKEDGLHRVLAWLGLLELLGIKDRGYAPRLYISSEEKEAARALLIKRAAGRAGRRIYAGIHPGAQIKSRCWPLLNFAAAAAYLRDDHGADISVFIEPGGYGEDIPLKGDFIKFKVSLREMISIISVLDILICNDSGAMHIAAATGTRSVAIFGAGDPRLIGPYGRAHTLVMDAAIGCRPCFDDCPYGKARCLEGVSLDSVRKAIDRSLLKEEGRVEDSAYQHR